MNVELEPEQKPFEDVAFLADSYDWPNWPVCPVKRYDKKRAGGFPTCGIVLHDLPRVYEVNMFKLPISPEDFDKCVKHDYDSFGAMVADGWVVD